MIMDAEDPDSGQSPGRMAEFLVSVAKFGECTEKLVAVLAGVFLAGGGILHYAFVRPWGGRALVFLGRQRCTSVCHFHTSGVGFLPAASDLQKLTKRKGVGSLFCRPQGFARRAPSSCGGVAFFRLHLALLAARSPVASQNRCMLVYFSLSNLPFLRTMFL
jgi:hypothetical protein